MEQNKIKKCKKCKRKLPQNADFFYVNNGRKDKLSSECKECMYGKNNENFNFDLWYHSKSDSFRNRWDYLILKLVYENYHNLTKQNIIKMFPNENYKTVTNIIYQWNIRKTEKNDDWSEEDIEFLIQNYPSMHQKGLESRFSNRTWHAIKTKASKLNISRDENTLFKIRSESHIGFKPSDETRQKMSMNRRGEKSWNWKGGVSPLHPYLRDKILEWKFDSLQKYNFVCLLTGENDGTLHVHHLNRNFSEIIQDTFKELNLPIHRDMTIYTQEELLLIDNKFVELHFKNGLGVPLLGRLHKLFHQIYGNKNNTPDQFEEFKVRYWNGEFRVVS